MHGMRTLAARAILRAGTGHKYWSHFPPSIQDAIQEVSREIHENLFKPALNTPIKTLDIPVGGRGYSAEALPLSFDLVNLANGVRIVRPKPNAKATVVTKNGDSDHDGNDTLKFLKATRVVVNRMSGLHPSSLGLHPVIYFYSAAGRYQPTSFLAAVSLMKDLEREDLFDEFTRVRRQFEDFLLKHRTFPNQVSAKYGSGPRGFERLKEVYFTIFENLRKGKSEDETMEALRTDDRFSVLAVSVIAEEQKARREFNSEAKSAVFLKTALEHPMRCKICDGLIHFNSITIDHIIRKQDGGLGVTDNGQIAHPYCNTTYKQ